MNSLLYIRLPEGPTNKQVTVPSVCACHSACVCSIECLCVYVNTAGIKYSTVCVVSASVQQSCVLYLSFCVCKGGCCYVCHVSQCCQLTCSGADPSVPSCGSPICCSTPKPSVTHPSPLATHKQRRQAFLPSFHLHTTRQPSPSVTIYSPAQPHFALHIHPHLHPLSHFPKRKNTFFSNMFGSFLSLSRLF